MAERTEEKEINKKYNTFEELYKDYKDIIDTEFALRHRHRLCQLKESIENREKWMEAHIMQDDGRNNQYYYKKAELLEEVYEVVDKELNLPICNSTLDYEIKKVKNKIVDELFTGRMNEYRGKGEYEHAFRRAGMLADIIEYAMKGIAYSKEAYNSDNLVSLIDESNKKCNYHKDKVFKMVHDTIEKRDLMKIATALVD